MNTFAHLVRLEKLAFGHVQYFSLQPEDDEVTIFEDFLNRMEDKAEADGTIGTELERMMNWIEAIGREVRFPLRDGYFRHEGRNSDTKALPPPAGKAKGFAQRKAARDPSFRMEELETGMMRLYCMVANDHVVILFNGDIKSDGINDANDCPVVGPYFKQANRLARILQQHFVDGDIRWNETMTDIDYDEDLTIAL